MPTITGNLKAMLDNLIVLHADLQREVKKHGDDTGAIAHQGRTDYRALAASVSQAIDALETAYTLAEQLAQEEQD